MRYTITVLVRDNHNVAGGVTFTELCIEEGGTLKIFPEVKEESILITYTAEGSPLKILHSTG